MSLGLMAIAAGVVMVLVSGIVIAVHRPRASRIDTPEAAASAAEQAIPGFVVAGAVVGADGMGALAVSADSRVVVVATLKRRVVAREVRWSAVRATPYGILIETGDRRIGRLALAGVDALDIRRLTGVGGAPRDRGPVPHAA